MFPPINNGYQQPQFDQYQSYTPQNQIQSQNFNQFSMNPSQFQPYYMQPYESPIQKYSYDLDSYYEQNRDKVFAKFNQRNTNPNPPLGGASKMGVPQLPQIRLPVVDWENFQKDANSVLQQQNKFMRNLDQKIMILDNLMNQSEDWLVDKYEENKIKYEKAKISERNFKLKKALTDYKKFARKYYGAFKNPNKNNNYQNNIKYVGNPDSQTSIGRY